MNYKRYPSIIFLCFLLACSFLSCQNTESAPPQKMVSQTIALDFQNDLIPEGIAVDKASGKIFLSSLAQSKIVSCDLDGKNPKDLLASRQYNYKSGFGMKIFDGKLFALSNTPTSKTIPSTVTVLNLADGMYSNAYLWSDTTNQLLNDLTISSKGEIFITNSHGNSILKLNYPDGKIEKWMTSDDFVYGNGIAISEDDKYLFVATWEKGVRIIDIATQKILNPTSELSRGMDGLKFYKNELYGMYNGDADFTKHELVRLVFNEDKTDFIKKETVFAANDYFNFPTTFDIVDDVVYFISNAQLTNFDDATYTVKAPILLESYYLVRHPLNQ